MALDALQVDPLTLRVGENSTVSVTVKRLGEDFDISDTRYDVRIRGRERGATSWLCDEGGDKVGAEEPAVAEVALPAWAAADEGKTLEFLVVLVDEDAAPLGAETESGFFEEVLGSFTRTVKPGLVGTP